MNLQDSWTEFIYVRCQNCNRKPMSIKSDDERPTHSKKPKIEPLKHTYPSIEIVEFEEDEIAHDRNLTLLHKEIDKPKSKFLEISELMARTLKRRRNWILNEVRPIKEIYEKYPFLKKTKFVSSLICNVIVCFICYCLYREGVLLSNYVN